MDGWEVLTELKADPATADIPVVVVSIVDDRPRGLALGAAAYLTKPVGREELLDALRGVGRAAATAGASTGADRDDPHGSSWSRTTR